MITVNVTGLGAATTGGYIPDCSGSYNPCTEVLKAKSIGRTVTVSLQAKCNAYSSACGNKGDPRAAAVSVSAYQARQANIGPTRDLIIPSGDVGIVAEQSPGDGSSIGFDDEPWYMNKTYWVLGGVVVVGAALLLWK